MEYLSLVGQRFGMLTVLSFEGPQPYKHRYNYYYRCQCDCGNETTVTRSNLLRPRATSSCGCLKKRSAANNPTWTGHGEISGRLWSRIKSHATKRGLSFEITIEEVWDLFLQQDKKCALSGLDLSMKGRPGGPPNAETASLDRIDNTRGYIQGNIQWLHKDINWMKGRFTQSRFLALCRAVTLHGGADE